MPADSVRGRFAPSPTGELHLGSASTALCAWLSARSAGGQFLLRSEDLDRPRVVPGMAEAQAAALRALGLDWDEGPDLGGPHGPYRQSERDDRYREALAQLDALGLLYPCYCTRSELNRELGPGAAEEAGEDGPRYPGTCRTLTTGQRKAHERSGRRPALRFKADGPPVGFVDRFLGPQRQEVAAQVGDFIVKRRDGIIAYQLAVVVDDGAMGITEVVRGADLLGSTARQILLHRALGTRPPSFAHAPLWRGPDGLKLSKRHGKIGVHTMLDEGTAPGLILAQLAQRLELPRPARLERAADLLPGFDPERLGSAG